MIGKWRSRFTYINPLKFSEKVTGKTTKLPSPGHERKKLVRGKSSLKASLDLLFGWWFFTKPFEKKCCARQIGKNIPRVISG